MPSRAQVTHARVFGTPSTTTRQSKHTPMPHKTPRGAPPAVVRVARWPSARSTVAAVSPSRDDRTAARRIADTLFREVYVATPAEVCESRDPKGHYAKARVGALQAFTGIGSDYQPPATSELSIDTSSRSIPDATEEIERMLATSGVLFDELVDLAANI